MKKPWTWLGTLAAVAIIFAAVASAQGDPPAAESVGGEKIMTEATAFSVEDLSWMTGSWRLENGPVVVDEHWSAPAGGTLIGMCRFVRDGKLYLAEMLLIEETPDGVFFRLRHYGAGLLEKHADPLSFKLTRLELHRAEFENADASAEFPRVMRYEREDGILRATLEGKIGEKEAKQVYEYHSLKN